MLRLRHRVLRAASLAVLGMVAGFTVTPSVVEGASKSRTTAPKTSKTTTSVVTSAIPVAKLIEATRTAGLRDAYRFGVTLGNPTCPSGTKSSTAAVQCLVSLGATSVAYLVTATSTGTLVAESTFPLVATADLTAAIRKAITGLTIIDCGKAPFLIQPIGSVAHCKVGGGIAKTVDIRVLNIRGDLRVETPVS